MSFTSVISKSRVSRLCYLLSMVVFRPSFVLHTAKTQRLHLSSGQDSNNCATSETILSLPHNFPASSKATFSKMSFVFSLE